MVFCPKIELKTFSIGELKGALRGRSPQAKLWAIKSSALKYRAGGQINYYFLHKAFNFWIKSIL